MTDIDIAALVERLRAHQCGCGGACGQRTPAHITEAADALEALQARVEHQRKEQKYWYDRYAELARGTTSP